MKILRRLNKVRLLAITVTTLITLTGQIQAQPQETLEDILSRVPSAAPGLSLPPLPEEPIYYETGEGMDIEVTVVAKGLHHPWGLASLPDGTLLVTERNNGQLRVIRDGVLDSQPVAGLPEVTAASFSGLHDVILHPDFENNHWLYLTYNKEIAEGQVSLAISRGIWDGNALLYAEDIFIAGPGVSGASRLLFGADGMLYATFYGSAEDSQDLSRLNGKIIRLTENGKVPEDNPYVNTPNARPEIYTYGHRTPQGLILHPLTGEIWNLEMGPNGGDEVNILKPKGNYGWPMVSLGRDYAGAWQGNFQEDGMEDPLVYWMPSISVSGMVLYTGDKLPQWRGDLLVGGLRTGQISGTGQLQRIRLNALGQEIRREALLTDLRYRIRGAHQGSDGYLYVLTDEENGAVLRIGAVQ